MADCAGRMEDRPKRIKVEVLPYDEVDVDTLLSELVSSGLIVRYDVADQRLIEIPTFARHQRISGKEADTESRFPGMQKKKMGKRSGSNGEAPEKHPESLETEGRRKGDGDDAFAVFWKSYPKKKDKETARKAFQKITAELPVILAAVDRFKSDPDWIKNDGQFIPYPATWLNGKRWEDEGTETTEPSLFDGDPERWREFLEFSERSYEPHQYAPDHVRGDFRKWKAA